MRKKIAIFCGGPSSEYDVSLNSARTISHEIDNKKNEIYFFFISKDLMCKLLPADPTIDFEKAHPSATLIEGLESIKKKSIFALLAGIHGEFVEDGRLQTILEIMDIPFSGSNSKASVITMDKYISSLVAQKIEEIAIPKTNLLHRSDDTPDISYPVIIKPNTLGSSVGVYVVKNRKELVGALDSLRDDLNVDEILIQELIDDAIEIQCGCLQDKNGKFIKLPPIEIRPKKALFFDYASKYEVGGSDEITPPVSISASLSEKVSDLATTLHQLLGLKTYSRSDFLIKNDTIYYLETNTLPGMTATSLLPQEAKAIGISFSQLLDFIIENS